MKESLTEVLDLEELVGLGYVERSTGTHLSRSQHRVGGKVGVMLISEQSPFCGDYLMEVKTAPPLTSIGDHKYCRGCISHISGKFQSDKTEGYLLGL